MLFYVPAARADPLLFTIVLAGLVATLNAALVTLAFVTICDVALGSTGFDRARAMRNFAKVSAPVVPVDRPTQADLSPFAFGSAPLRYCTTRACFDTRWCVWCCDADRSSTRGRRVVVHGAVGVDGGA